MQQTLAERMRPKTIEEMIGQEHLVGKDAILYRMVKANRLSSMILFGPPGIGKTSLSRAIAGSSDIPYFELNAVSAVKKDLENVIKHAVKEETSVLLYIDEIHMFNKKQVQFLLPYMEDSTIILIASTTESIAHEIPPAIRSRSQIYELEALDEGQIQLGLERALNDKQNGLGEQTIEVSGEAMEHFVYSCGGDMRQALTGLEIAALSTNEKEGIIFITEEVAKESLRRKTSYGTNSSYDIRSAYQKSIRGSDVNAGLYWLARMIDGADLDTIIRRTIVTASEDIGLANPELVGRSITMLESCRKIGLPEARILLAQVVVELCLSPKSNTAYKAMNAAIAEVNKGNEYDVPPHLKDSHYKDANKYGRGIGYIYPHDHPFSEHGKQLYLPDELAATEFYEPKMGGHEKVLGTYYEKINEIRKK